MKIIAPICFLISMIIVVSCSKSSSDDDTKVCYECISYSVKEYKDGSIRKDTFVMYPCQTKSFMDAFLKNGNGESDTYDIVGSGNNVDTVYYHYNVKTTCNKR